MKIKLRRRWVILIASALVLAVLSSAIWFLFLKKTTATGDYSDLSWTQAFDKMDRQLSKEYAFTEWKHIDWTSL